MNRDEAGFSLIELLVILIVIGILAAVVVVSMTGEATPAARTACKADARSVELAQEAAHTLTGQYLADLGSLVPTYLREVPGNSGHYVITTDNTGTVYVTAPPDGPVSFDSSPNPCDSVE